MIIHVMHHVTWDQMNLCCCSAAVTVYFLCVFVNCFVAYIAMVSWGVMIG